MGTSSFTYLFVCLITDVVGCFHVRGFLSHLRQVPDHPITLQTALWICNRRNPNPINPAKQLISYDMNSLEGSVFDPGLPTKIIVHGYGGQFKSPTIIAAKNAILQAVRFCHTNLLLFLRRQCCTVFIWWRHRIHYTFIAQPLREHVVKTCWHAETVKNWRVSSATPTKVCEETCVSIYRYIRRCSSWHKVPISRHSRYVNTGYELDRPEIESLKGKTFFILTNSRPSLDLLSLLFNGYWGAFHWSNAAQAQSNQSAQAWSNQSALIFLSMWNF